MTYTHVLTDPERACGVTHEAVAEALPNGLFISGGTKFVLSANLSPALASSTARAAFAVPVAYLGFNSLKQPVYCRDAQVNAS